MAISLVPQFFFVSILLSSIICITNFTHAHSQCLHDQKTLLLELRNDLIFDRSYSTKLVQWNQTEDCCSWEGVECDGGGHVISLQLDDEGISGGLDGNSSSLFSIIYLEKLNLAYNHFNFSHIPRGIGSLTYLTHLNLSDAWFGGQIPIELSLLSRLVSLDISGNERIEPLNEHINLTMLLQNLTRLRELILDGIDLSAQGSDWCQVIPSTLPDLRILSLRDCDLSGPLDTSLSQLHSLSILQLDGNNLSSAVPVLFANFSSLSILSLRSCFLKGSFPEMIFQVPTLQELALSYNELLSGTIPQFPLSRALRYIDMSYCSFSGQIPSTLANLTELVFVDLSDNFFTGLLPPLFMSKKLAYIDLNANSLTGSLSSLPFEGLPNLVYLNLGRNSLSGSIPHSLFGLPSLRIVDLSGNQFGGQVNEFPTLNFSNLYYLDLSSNRLEGPIPESFFQLESLEGLWLSYNFFSGTFRLEKIFHRLHNLTSLDLSYNNLSVDASNINSSLSTFPQLQDLSLASCNLHKFPDFLKQSTSLRHLDLSNNWIAGEIPSWFWEVGNGTLEWLNLSSNLLVDLQKPYKIPSYLDTLDLHSNQLQGELPIPPRHAYYVDYSNNNFDKPLPLNIGNFTSLSYFFAANNSLSGSIPTSLCNATNLDVLDLSANKLTGNIPSCLLENMEYLWVFNLGRNNINGNIPDIFSVNSSLKSLDLSNNNLRGNIPKSLGNCKSLVVMNVAYNHIDDSFPCMLPSSLRVLVLRSNNFHGEVRCHKSWPNLQIIDIASNNFSGSLYPINFTSWRAMMRGRDAQRNRSGSNFLDPRDYYRVVVTITIKGSEQKLVKIGVDCTTIDFSCNNFRGEIPDAIGNLSSLHLLNLSHNALTGTIPKSFGDMMQLESLDLSVNQLTGKVPNELGRLTFLSSLNLSYNKLVGEIPKGRQFQTFSADSFKGNTGLCGFPLNKSCSNTTDKNGSSPPKPKIVEIEWEYVSAALGYVVGLGGFLWVILCCHSLRRTYFEKVDEVLEEMFDSHDRKRRHGIRRRAVRNQVSRQ